MEQNVEAGNLGVPLCHSISNDSSYSQTSQSHHTKIYPNRPVSAVRNESFLEYSAGKRTPYVVRIVLIVNCITLILLLLACGVIFMYLWMEIRNMKEDFKELQRVKEISCICSTPTPDNSQEETAPADITSQHAITNPADNQIETLKKIVREELANAGASTPEGDIHKKHAIAFAHIGGKGRRSKNHPGFNHLHNWNTKSEAFSDENSLFSNQGIRISEFSHCFHINITGWYYIYSQVYWNNVIKLSDSETVAHEIIRKRDQRDGSEADIKSLMVSISKATYNETKYNGGIFHLKKNHDSICLRLANNFLEINMDPKYSYFGLFLLAEKNN